MDAQQILQTYSDNFNLDTILGSIIRELLWGIIQGSYFPKSHGFSLPLTGVHVII